MKHVSATVQQAPVGVAQYHNEDSERINAFIITNHFTETFFLSFSNILPAIRNKKKTGPFQTV